MYGGPLDSRPRRAGLPAFTVVLAILWLLLAIYIFTHPDPFGIIILVVMAVFIALPVLIVTLGTRRARQHQVADEHDTQDTLDSQESTSNGRYAAGANGAQPRDATNIPEDGGSNL